MFKEFKEFAMRGNVVDMAVGIIIGGAFGTIVKSLVGDVLMPPIGLLAGRCGLLRPVRRLQRRNDLGAVRRPWPTPRPPAPSPSTTASSSTR